MDSPINETLIREAAQHRDWYLRIEDHYNHLRELGKQDEQIKKEIKEGIRALFEDMMSKGELVIGGPMPELDQERQAIDTVVIHHTSDEPGMRLERLNVIQLLGIYMPHFQHPQQEKEKHHRGMPIASNHFYGGKTVFWGYHWLLRMDGRAERLLPDDAIGWHSGDWGTNCRSIGICLDNDYEHKDPEPHVLEALGRLIREQYSSVSQDRIPGHKEVTETVCPGGNFERWKHAIKM